MTGTQSITFLWTPASLGVSIAAVLATAVTCGMACHRSGWRKPVLLLESLRLLIVCLAAVLLNQPEWVEEFRPQEKPTVAVLWDSSISMQTRDVLPTILPDRPSQPEQNAQTSSQAISRKAAIEPLTTPEAWSRLQDQMNVVLEPFSTEAAGGTNLFEPLATATEKFTNLGGVVLISDGDWNEGDPPAQAAAKLRLAQIPVVTVPVGSPTRLPDVEVLSLDAPTFGVSGKSVRIPFAIESSLPRDYVTTIKLSASDGSEMKKEIRVAAMGRTTDAIVWKPEGKGDLAVTLLVPPHGDEVLRDNNRLSAPIAIRDEKLSVLVVESEPRWEYRYLRNALSRDPGVDVRCLLFHPGLSKVGGGNKDYIQQFPEELEELSKFDVIFLGDVGLDAGQLTPEQCRRLKGLVEQQASGLVFLPGMQGRQFSLLDTELSDLMPVVLDASQPNGWGSRIPGHFELSELGRRSLLTKLADTQDENIDVWEGLPGFQWYAPVLRAKAGGEVLCVHKDMTNEHGRLPLLVTGQLLGAGKVLFMGTDGAWRWRKGVEDKYHYRFWGQVVRWMAYQRNMAKGETMRLYYSPDQPQIRQTVTLNANVMEQGGEPLHRGEVTARITAPSGKSEVVRLASAGDEWGLFSGRLETREPGRHQVVLFCKETNATLETALFVQGTTKERIGRPARLDVMEEIARATNGKQLALNKIDEIVDLLQALPEPALTVHRLQIWSHPATAAVLVVLLGLFWAGRKAVGLI